MKHCETVLVGTESKFWLATFSGALPRTPEFF